MADYLVNGRAASSIALDDRGLNYGDGLFETIAVRGARLRLFDYHFERLCDGGKKLGLEVPESNLLQEELLTLLGDRHEATARIVLTRGPGPRGYALPPQLRPTRIVSVDAPRARIAEHYARGVRLHVCRTPIGIQPGTAGAKTLNRLEQILARMEWSDPAIAEGLMATPSGEVICGTMSNVFFVSKHRLLTPDLSRCGVAGVMRRLVIERARAIGYPVVEVFASLASLAAAEEIFLTNSQFGLWPVRRLRETQLVVGPITRTLMQALAGAGIDECRT